MFIPRKVLEGKLVQLLTEDIGFGDITSGGFIPANLNFEAEVIAKEAGLAAGIDEVTILADILGLKVKNDVLDGEIFIRNQKLMRIFGDARLMLSSERTILNLLSRMCGIATATNRLINKLKKAKLKTKLAATRKTVPGMNYFDKKAVLLGGGDTHRMNLTDMILIKNNHITIMGNLLKAIQQAKNSASFSKKIEVEVSEINDVIVAARAGVDIIMLDNFSPKKINKAIELLKNENYFGKLLLEASGGITFDNFLEYARTQVDIISLGALTHSVKSLDIALKIIKEN